MYRIEYRRPARKALTRMPPKLAARFLAAFEVLAGDPQHDGDKRGGLDVKPLTGRDGYRLRIGRWRALYRVEEDRLVVLVLEIGPRGDVYK
jgi:mRNA interferase RelE/StbE